MDFRFTPEEEAFKLEITEFLDKECTEEFKESLWARQEPDFSMEFTRKLAARGWLSLPWPKEYGGGGASMIQQLIFSEAMGYYEAPTGAHRQGVNLVGPTLIVHGNEEQKKRHLGAIARAEAVWCEGFSEPEAGSDAASIRTRAVRKGDDYVINGQKVWTTNAHYATWMYVTARTNPEVSKTRGISYFLVDMKTPGLQVRPLINMLGSHDFNEVFFDDLRVPKENLVGQENNGWHVINTLLEFEHSGIAAAATCQRSLERLVEFCKETKIDGRRLSDDPVVRGKLADMTVEVEVARMMSYHIAWMQSKGQHVTLEGPMCKAFGSELRVRLSKTGMDILGLYGSLSRDSKWAFLRGSVQREAMWALGRTIAGGTNEIQKYIMATRGLGLPKGPR